ncbi:glyoxalase [Acidovorax sp. Leaf76]|uniref:VOC family protein n=1 Tax=unclassified Acidovorax TaxID=2684926 RepID=UPI0007003F44|nr:MULTISPECIES: VOC family protein [unclassified Acidovorax]KQO12353.1 glyoxalase [Acidovorax sp. Leaf76]KQO29081.1 glyoxalase [Acidovorax sp. Leaf84]KQS25602.1 glyoxalase [Acidovorax sp. Leaf191]
MIDHTGITVSELGRSRQFYESVLSTLGYGVRLALEDAVGFGARELQPGDDPGGDFWISAGPPFTPRSHIAFRAHSEAQVVAFHQAALFAGGSDNGAPGLRPQYHARYFAAFVLDPDGYNIEAVFHGAAPAVAYKA